ncbi:hypothetical protein [Luteibacter sp.]|jgi:hypothetical protein|uniref:hypothetical protein n=1 Tax=Luteibacter sp. TaxID=1886636 RepID=UPI002F417841
MGRRVIDVNGFPLADTDRCADEATLKRLSDYYKSNAEKYGLRREKLDPEVEKR